LGSILNINLADNDKLILNAESAQSITPLHTITKVKNISKEGIQETTLAEY
jgi:hypothetical protein